MAYLVSVGKDYSAQAVKHADDEIGSLVDSFNEMLTQIEAREHALRESEERYALAARGSNDGLWDWNQATGQVYFSSRWNQMLGFPEAETWSGPESWFRRIHPNDRERVRAEIAAHRDGASPEFATEYRIRQRSGAFLWVLSRGMAVRDARGAAVRIAGSQTDVTQGKVADPLTGLPNRLYLLDRLESALESADCGAGGTAVLFLDMDRFKLINDSMGHAAGDALLNGVSDRLRAGLLAAQASGSVGETSFVARLGGDEFAILLHPVGDPSNATALAVAMLKDLNTPFPIAGHQVFVSLSIGVALSCAGDTPAVLLGNADTAMYRAKTEGKTGFAVFDDSMRKQAIVRLEIESELRKAIANREMVLHFQPQASLRDGLFTGFEALVRWMHPDRGLISPADFIPVAEETGLIFPLGAWVLQEACRQTAEWQARFVFDPPLTIAVNVPAADRQRFCRRSGEDPGGNGPRAAASQSGADGERRHEESGGVDRESAALESARSEPRSRRFRYGLLVAELSELPADRHREDRPVVRRGTRRTRRPVRDCKDHRRTGGIVEPGRDCRGRGDGATGSETPGAGLRTRARSLLLEASGRVSGARALRSRRPGANFRRDRTARPGAGPTGSTGAGRWPGSGAHPRCAAHQCGPGKGAQVNRGSGIACTLLTGMLIHASAAAPPTEEYRVKGAFLLNFTSFVQWPAQAFRGPGDAIAICVLGTNPFTPELDLAARRVVADKRAVTVRQIPDAQHARGCQIVFVSVSERKHAHALIQALQGQSVLTVGESEGFVASGGVIEFRVEENRVRMEIGTEAAKRARLNISSKLLSLVQAARK